MSKLTAFVKMDFITVKPYFTVKNLLIYATIAIYMAVMSQNIASAISIGMMLATLNVSYPFALAEKSNLDALYVTLGADKKTVVKGRYAFAMLLNLCVVLFMLVLSAITLVLTNSIGNIEEIWSVLGATVALSAVFLIIQATQLPLFFKMPYSKAKFISLVPFFLLMAFVTYFIMNANGSGMPDWINAAMQNLVENTWIVGVVGSAVLVGIIFISYNLSLAFYAKRDF